MLCLNIGVDPPDVIKISPCARLECWVDPLSMQPPKALDTIGMALSPPQSLVLLSCSVTICMHLLDCGIIMQARTFKHSMKGGSLEPSTRCIWIPPWMMSKSWQSPVDELPRWTLFHRATAQLKPLRTALMHFVQPGHTGVTYLRIHLLIHLRTDAIACRLGHCTNVAPACICTAVTALSCYCTRFHRSCLGRPPPGSRDDAAGASCAHAAHLILYATNAACWGSVQKKVYWLFPLWSTCGTE